MDSAKITLHAIASFLETTCGLTRATVAGESSLRPPAAKGCGRYFVVGAGPERFRLRVDGHLEIGLDCLIVDGRLGSLGLIRVLGDNAQASDNKNLLSFIEEAAYLRHVLDAKRAQSPDPEKLLPYAVEVVFVEPRSAGASAADLGEALRESLRFTALPHALSVGFAHLANVSVPHQREQLLRRAFCWLLPGTEAWLSGLKQLSGAGGAAGEQPVGWDTLVLENFRRPATRRWTKNSRARLHVLHGPNGSGKSSLAEAFEFAVTGWAGRLGEKPTDAAGPRSAHFAPLIWRAGSTPGAGAPVSAEVRLFDGETPLDRRSTTRSANDSAPRALHADSFRLDQKLGDRLIDTTTRDRRWLEIFFKDFDDELQLRRAAQQRLDNAIAQLGFARPPATPAAGPTVTPPPTSDAAAVVVALARTDEKTPLSLLQFLDALPGGPKSNDLQALSSLDLRLPEILRRPFRVKGADIVDSTPFRKDLVEALKADAAKFAQWEAFTNDKFDGLLGDIGKDFFGAPVKVEHERAPAFNRWLRRVALVDLLEKSLVVASTTAHLGANAAPTDEEWADTATLLETIAPRATVEDLDRRLKDARAERDNLRAQLSTIDAKQRAKTDGPAAQPRRLAARELQPLFQAVGSGVFGHLLKPDDGKELADTIQARRKTRVRELAVGEAEWTSPLRQAAQSRRRAREILGALLPSPAAAQAEEKANALLAVVTAARALALMESTAAGRFQEKVERGPLGTALEELLALFTPARWAYAAVETKVDVTGAGGAGQGSASLEFKTRGLDATKILNTAELNTLSLALYLLCAPRVENPFRVIFLDDPLQNMDELTVTTVARGLARLMRLWSGDERLKHWSLVMLLNGEGNCERMVREAPAARYQFPWLAPVGAGGGNAAKPNPRNGLGSGNGNTNGASSHDPGPEDVVALPGSAEGALQPLDGLMEIVIDR